jgi:hypothetical protein
LIQVKLTDQREYAIARYNRRPDAELLELSINTDGVSIKHNLSIPEAEQLIKDLGDWIHEIKD